MVPTSAYICLCASFVIMMSSLLHGGKFNCCCKTSNQRLFCQDIFSYKAGTDSGLDENTSMALREMTVQRQQPEIQRVQRWREQHWWVAQTDQVAWAAEAVTVMRWVKDVRATMTARIAEDSCIGGKGGRGVQKRGSSFLYCRSAILFLLTPPRGLSSLL